MSDHSPRYMLPYIFVGQAQKEITHNEALAAIDALLHPAVEAVLNSPPATVAADEGKCWLAGNGASGAWAGRDGQLACCTGTGWRFLRLPVGTRMRDLSLQSDLLVAVEGIIAAPQIPDPDGGAVVDQQVRDIIVLLLEHLRSTGVLADGT